MSWSLRITGLEEATAEVRAAVAAGFEAAIERIGIRGAQLVQSNITSPFNDKPAAVSTSNLAQSIQHERVADPLTHKVVVFAGAPADVYAAPVETGTRPHFPPIEPLVQWVKRKFNHIRHESEARSLAFIIARSIARRGTRGHLMFQRASDALYAEARPIAERAIAEEIQRRGVA